jgi:NitT/TauT family transport system permease protein
MMFSTLKIREVAPRRGQFILGFLSIFLFHLIWLSLTYGKTVEQRFLSPQILPNPIDVILSFKSLIVDRDLFASISYSFFRTTVGFLIAAMVAVPLGILMGSFPKIRAFFQPVSTIGGYLPIAVLVPLTLSWFGLGEEQKIAFLSIATFVMLLPLIVSSIEAVDDVYLQTGYTLGATRWQTISTVLVPVAQADIYDHLCLTYGIGWGYIILAEVINAKYGLGYLITLSQRRGPIEHVYAVIIVIILIGMMINYTLAAIGRWLFPYRKV